ncbi:hypothetical protein HTT03_15720 [Sulfitobacter sp. S0837]|uniref:hypothetical protein n=1 Tax=Sulfitobacter maritimus TaxID=2741719 RepID=UPI001583E0F7|nr:hypothetical protein [Sulfitobacter maritimus]NUH66730.1 hypothetical protein [Sulfitobacter maritimus]
MSRFDLTKTVMRQGVWQGVLTARSGEGDAPQIAVTHLGKAVEGVSVTAQAGPGRWELRVPIPVEAVADGVQTLIITDQASGDQLGNVTLIAGEALGDDIRAEMDLLRAELDMLKRAFRRHCRETG